MDANEQIKRFIEFFETNTKLLRFLNFLSLQKYSMHFSISLLKANFKSNNVLIFSFNTFDKTFLQKSLINLGCKTELKLDPLE